MSIREITVQVPGGQIHGLDLTRWPLVEAAPWYGRLLELAGAVPPREKAPIANPKRLARVPK